MPRMRQHEAPTFHSEPIGLRKLPGKMRGRLKLALATLIVAEVVASVYLACLNPVAGYDENWNLINSHRFAGSMALPYALHRPPLLSLMLAAMGSYYRLLPALAHIGSTILTFAILRRLVSPAMAIGGALVFAVSSDLRFYGTQLLTEIPSVFFLLLALYLFSLGRSVWVGVMATMLMMTHWSMATFAPGVLVVYAMHRRWRSVTRFFVGAGLTAVPFLIASALAYGNPLEPLLIYLGGTSASANDLLFYVQILPVTWLPICVGSAFTLYWLATQRRGSARSDSFDLCLLILITLAGRLVLTHSITDKGMRYLVPLLPLGVVLSVFALEYYTRTLRSARWVLWPVLIISICPTRGFVWRMREFRTDSVSQLVELEPFMANLDKNEVIYTDVNDLAVMGHTGYLTVAVPTEASPHHPLYNRAFTSRRQIPTGSLYLTWDPGTSKVLASATPTRRGTLHLVRWDGRSPLASGAPN